MLPLVLPLPHSHTHKHKHAPLGRCVSPKHRVCVRACYLLGANASCSCCRSQEISLILTPQLSTMASYSVYYRSTPTSGSQNPNTNATYTATATATCYVPRGIQRPPSRTAATAYGTPLYHAGHSPMAPQPSSAAAGYVAGGAGGGVAAQDDIHAAPPMKMSSQIATMASSYATPAKQRKPLADASFITQAAQRTGSTACPGGTPSSHYQPQHPQCSPVKLPPTPSRQPHSSSVALLRSHALQHHRPLLVLDLDETLVHASVETTDGSHDVAFVVELNQQRINVYVKIRPFAHEFLRRVGQLFEVCVFTASLAPYADRVVDYLDPAGTLVHHRLYREHCTNVDGNYVKDMSLMGRSMERIAIVDNSPVAYSFHPENAIPITSWFEDTKDTELMQLMPALEHFAHHADFSRTRRKFAFKVAAAHR